MKTFLFKPFEKYSESKLLITGTIATLLGTYFAYFLGLRFDGVLDLHFSKTTIEQSFIDTLINVASLILALFIASKTINEKSRLVDIVTTVLIARIPLYLLTLINTGGVLSKLTGNIKLNQEHVLEKISTSGIAVITIFSICAILAIIWYIALLYNGYKTSANAKGQKSTVLFIVAIILAEALSKLLIYQFN